MTRRPARTMALPLPVLLAARYLKSARRQAFATFLSLLATGGIALGVGALILVLGGLAGLQTFLRGDVMARTPHLEVAAADAAMAEQIAAVPGVVGVRRVLRGRGWMLAGGRPLNVEVLGFEGELPRFFPEPRSSDGGDRAPGLYLDRATAGRWGLLPGDAVELVSPRPTLTPFGPQPRIHQLPLRGTFAPGRTEHGENRVAVPLDVAEKLFGERLTRLEVEAESFEDALDVAASVAALLPAGTEVRTWQDLNRGLFFALRLEKMLMFVSVFLIVPVAAGALVTVLGLLISAKRGEIGMLQAMGARPGEIRRGFLLLGFLLAGAGLTLGLSGGISLALLFDRYELVRPPGDVYFLHHIPFVVQTGDVAAVVAATVLLTAFSAHWAARRAASLPAVEALRQ